MKNTTKKFMQISFAVHRKLGKEASLLLSYLIFKSSDIPNDKGHTNIVCTTRSSICEKLDFTRHEYDKACKILISNSLISIIEKYVGGANGFKLNVKKIDNFIGLAEANDGLAEANDGLAEANDGLAEANDGLAEAGSNNQQSTINNQQSACGKNIHSQQQAVSLHEQARSGEESVYLAGSYEEALAKLEKQEQDIHPSMEVDWLDTPSIIKKKARKTRKQIKDISHQELDPKWIPFQEYIEEFGIKYPAHRDIAKTRAAGLELIKIHKDWTPEDIASVIKKIDAHYLGYCSKNGDYAKGPYNYLINELWTVPNTKNDPSSSTYSDGTPKRKPGVTRGWN